MHDLVMPSEEYSPLQQLVLEPGLLVVRALSELCHADRMPLAMGKNITFCIYPLLISDSPTVYIIRPDL